MRLTRTVILLLMTALIVMTTAAQDDDVPVVAILKFGEISTFTQSYQGSLDLFEAYGYVDGENIEFITGQAELNPSVAADLIRFTLNQDPDIIITTSTAMLVAAHEATENMDDPPMIVFNLVTSSEAVGVTQSPCIKPDHITGSTALPLYDFVLPQALEMGHDIQKIGVIYDENLPHMPFNIELIEAAAAEIGIEIFAQSVSSSTVVVAAAETMLGAGIDAFMIGPDSTVNRAIGDINTIAELAGIPVIATDITQANNGATVAFGVNYYQEGVDAARIAIHHLAGNIDVATTATNIPGDINIGVNLDSAAAQGIEINRRFVNDATFVIENAQSTELPVTIGAMTLEERTEADLEFLTTLECTAERIAEEQAALDS